MEMAQVRYFLALCRERNFTRAARSCCVAQPSLSNAINALEQELGAPLFDRQHNGTRLTNLGVEVEPYFKAIADNADKIRRVSHAISARELEIA